MSRHSVALYAADFTGIVLVMEAAATHYAGDRRIAPALGSLTTGVVVAARPRSRLSKGHPSVSAGDDVAAQLTSGDLAEELVTAYLARCSIKPLFRFYDWLGADHFAVGVLMGARDFPTEICPLVLARQRTSSQTAYTAMRAPLTATVAGRNAGCSTVSAPSSAPAMAATAPPRNSGALPSPRRRRQREGRWVVADVHASPTCLESAGSPPAARSAQQRSSARRCRARMATRPGRGSRGHRPDEIVTQRLIGEQNAELHAAYTRFEGRVRGRTVSRPRSAPTRPPWRRAVSGRDRSIDKPHTAKEPS